MAADVKDHPRRFPERLCRAVWGGLVALGTMYVKGEMQRAEGASSAQASPLPAPPGPVPPVRALLLDAPPAGHPERLRPDIPPTALELALQRELGIAADGNPGADGADRADAGDAGRGDDGAEGRTEPPPRRRPLPPTADEAS